jgi:hypothetical protein
MTRPTLSLVESNAGTPPDPHVDESNVILTCCVCDHRGRSVRNLVFMNFEAPPGFVGWACVVCGLPPRGALAVICDQCAEAQVGMHSIRYILGGRYSFDDVRVPLEGFKFVPFVHDLSKHPEEVLLDG